MKGRINYSVLLRRTALKEVFKEFLSKRFSNSTHLSNIGLSIRINHLSSFRSPSYKFLLPFFIFSSQYLFSQSDEYRKQPKVNYITEKYITKADKKIVKLHKKIKKKNNKTLLKFSQQEEKILYKLCHIKPIQADFLFESSSYCFNRINKILLKTKGKPNDYFPQLDSISSTLHLAERNPKLLDPKADKNKLDPALIHLNNLNKELEKYEATTQYTRSRKTVMNELAKENPFLKKEVTSLNKESYYYQQQIAEYKSIFKDRAKAENTAMDWLRKTPLSNNFIKKYGQLAMFNPQVPANIKAPDISSLSTLSESSLSAQNISGISSQNIMDTEVLEVPNSNLNLESNLPTSGLTTLADTKKLISNRMAELAPTGEGLTARKAEETKNLFKKLKASPIKSGNLADSPDFRVNKLKTKRFIDRVTYGGNLQFIPSTYIYPLGCGIGAQAAYQLLVKSNIGIGASYTAGFGKDISHLKYSHSGYGVRSFIDYQLKRSIYLQGGAERNFLPKTKFLPSETVFTNQLTPVNAALLGLKIKANSSKKSSQTLEISYNFLHTERSPALVMRAGWEFGSKHRVK